MLHSDRTLVYFGPPGTGKTTTLMRRVREAIDDGTPPPRIGYVAFTRAAAQEAKSRAAADLGIDPNALPYWGTLHSLAFRQLALTAGQLMTGEHWTNLGWLLDMKFGEPDEAGRFSPWANERGRRVQAVVAYRRARKQSLDLEDLWRDLGRAEAQLVDLYHRTLEAYKRRRGLWDYADMIEAAPGAVDVDVLIIDEAQDLTPVQWDYAERLAATAGQVYVAGDDDQAIYSWAGADVERFLGVPGERVVLGKSHRLPASVYAVADQIAGRIRSRQRKAWNPADRAGAVEVITDPAILDLSAGEWMLLARTRYALEQWADACRAQGVRFTLSGRDSVIKREVDAMRAWEALRAGRTISREHAAKALAAAGLERELEDARYSAADLGLEDMPVWRYALRQIPPARARYYEACLRHDPRALTSAPRVTISTIHACKGREADNVAILTDVTERIYRALVREPDDEHRVWYVAATRARERLVVVRPQGPAFYDAGVYHRAGVQLQPEELA